MARGYKLRMQALDSDLEEGSKSRSVERVRTNLKTEANSDLLHWLVNIIHPLMVEPDAAHLSYHVVLLRSSTTTNNNKSSSSWSRMICNVAPQPPTRFLSASKNPIWIGLESCREWWFSGVVAIFTFYHYCCCCCCVCGTSNWWSTKWSCVH